MNRIQFTHREPIGSSTYPMPDETLDQIATTGALERPLAWAPTTLYLHIPFCDQICSFCGFNKFVSSEEIKARYVTALKQEIAHYADTVAARSAKFEAVYLGGGTPNALSAEQLAEVLTALRESFDVDPSCEITCEGTPMNFDDERNDALLAGGVTRVSAGIQTYDRAIRLQQLHMRQGKEELLGYVETIANAFANFNLDLIFNLPGQTDEIWHDDLETAIASPATHLTIYPLVLLEQTIFYTDYVRKGLHLAPSQSREIDLFEWTQDRLASAPFGAGRYTVRDWARPGHACRYIQANAECANVLALGAGAHGFFGGYTYRNKKAIARYVDDCNAGILPVAGQRFLTSSELMERFTVMGLRQTTLDVSPFDRRFGIEWTSVFGEKLDALVRDGYVVVHGSKISYTPLGLVWANNIRSYFETRRGASVGYSDTASIGKSGKDHYSEISRVKATDAETA